MKKPAKFAEGGRIREYGSQEGTSNFEVPQYSLSDIFGTRRKKEETPNKGKEEDSRELAREARMNVPGMGPEASPRQTFGQAFREARRRGDQSFTWQGRRYTTEMARTSPEREPPLVRAPRGPARTRSPDMESRRPPSGEIGLPNNPPPRSPDTESRRSSGEGDLPRNQAPPREPRDMSPFERALGSQGGMSEEDIVRATRASQARMRTPEPIRESAFMRNLRRGIMGPEYAAEAETRASRGYTPRYAKGGTVKKAQGGTCRGMGAATRGGNYKFR